MVNSALPGSSNAASTKAISNLSVMQVKQLKSKIEGQLNQAGDSMDAYTKAHLYEASQRMGKALEAGYVYNQSSGGGSSQPIFLFGEPTAKSVDSGSSSTDSPAPFIAPGETP